MDANVRDRLEAAVVKWMGDCERPMQWGVDDCALSFTNVVRDALGYDPGDIWRGRYETQDGARSALGRAGLGFAFKRAAQKYGWARIDPEKGQVGDPGLCLLPVSDTETVVTAMICRGARGLWLVRNERGFSALPTDRVRVAWSLG